MIVRKDGHWKEISADSVADAQKAIDAEFADFNQPLVLVLPADAPAENAK